MLLTLICFLGQNLHLTNSSFLISQLLVEIVASFLQQCYFYMELLTVASLGIVEIDSIKSKRQGKQKSLPVDTNSRISNHSNNNPTTPYPKVSENPHHPFSHLEDQVTGEEVTRNITSSEIEEAFEDKHSYITKHFDDPHMKDNRNSKKGKI